MIMKRPSMRSAKIAASDTVARNSGALMREDVADGLDIRCDIRMNWDGIPPGGLPLGGLRWGGYRGRHFAARSIAGSQPRAACSMRRFDRRPAATLQPRITSPSESVKPVRRGT